MKRSIIFASFCAGGVTVAVATAALLQFAQAGAADGNAVRLQQLEARQDIEELFSAYGATLDRRDFDAFGRLFAEDATYGGGPGQPTHGRAAIQAQLEKTITANPSHLPTPDFHLYFNPSIHVEGDHATAQSKGAYVIPDLRTQGAEIIFLVSYDDTFVRRNGHWLFQQRMLHAGIPAPASQASGR
jgi:uncharacterized protein (TIGR02246 family)